MLVPPYVAGMKSSRLTTICTVSVSSSIRSGGGVSDNDEDDADTDDDNNADGTDTGRC